MSDCIRKLGPRDMRIKIPLWMKKRSEWRWQQAKLYIHNTAPDRALLTGLYLLFLSLSRTIKEEKGAYVCVHTRTKLSGNLIIIIFNR